MHFTDIKDALRRNDTAQIEDAFRALVGWPNEDTIIGADGSDRQRILRPVCHALRDNGRQMPGTTITTIEDSEATLYGGTYRNGAAAVLASAAYWHNRLADPEGHEG